jgi:tripartite-type tricarboxylate transporter receptor subunit TctC
MSGGETMTIRSWIPGAILVGVTLSCMQPAPAQGEDAAYPSKPVTFVIPSPAGGTADLACRLLLKSAERFISQPFVAVNRTGASFTIANAAIASSKPDGYTIGYTAMLGMLMAPFVMEQPVPYHPLKDFRQLIQFGNLNMAVTVKGDSPLRDIKDLIAFARQNPGRATYGTPGITSLGHLTMQQIARKEGVSLSIVPFRGGPEVQTALLGGHILLGTGDFNQSLIQSGQLRILFMIGESRSADYPEKPLAKDLGYDFPVPLYLSAAAPAGTPDDIARKLEQAFYQAMHTEEFIKGMKDLRINIFHRDSRELTQYMANAYQVYGALLRDLGLAKPGR